MIPPSKGGEVGLGAATALLDSLIAAGEELRRRPVFELVEVLGQVGARFLDPEDPLRIEALSRIPEEAHLSSEMAAAILEGMATDWRPEHLRRLLHAEFGDPELLDRFRPTASGSRLRAWGGVLAFHVGSGNVPGVSATSLLRSLLVKCPVLLKPGAGDRALPELYHRALAEADPELARAAAVRYWRREEGGELEEEGLRRAERIVVYGGEQTIEHIRTRVPRTTPLVAFPHRISMGAIARETLDDRRSALDLAHAAARAIALFERRGCVSPQLLWIEEGGELSPLEWGYLLAEALEELARRLPPPRLDQGTAAELQHRAEMEELRKVTGRPPQGIGGKDGSGWIDLGTEGGLPALGGRAIQLRSIADLEALGREVTSLAPYLQTLALEAPADRRALLIEELKVAGFTRFTTLEREPFPPAWWRHDGIGALLPLIHWIEDEG